MDAKVAQESAIRISLYKHRGDAATVATELGVAVKEVRRVRDLVKKKTNADVSFAVADSIMEFFVVGYQQRVGYLSELLHRLAQGHHISLSLCCNMPAMPREKVQKKTKKTKKAKKVKKKIVYVCAKCNKECRTYVTDDHSMLNFVFRAIGELRKEDEHLISGAARMGFVGENAPEPPAVVRQQNVIYVDGKDLTEGEQVAMREMENLDPIERQGLRLKLERKLLAEPPEQESVVSKATKKVAAKAVKKKKKRKGV